MLQNMRQNIQGPTTKIVVWLIVISFSIFGIESILVGGGGGGVAEVNGEEITPQELQQALIQQKRRLIAMMGDNIDPAMLEDEALQGDVLNALIGRKLQLQAAGDMDLTVSKREIGSLIGGMEEFQIEGVFSPQLFSSVLSNAGFTPAYFKETLREDVALAQLRSGLAGSEFATPLETVLSARVGAEQRDLQSLTIPLQGFIDTEVATDDEIAAYYAAHQDDFKTSETVELEYIVLSADQFRQPVEESAVSEAYEQLVASAQYQTENRVAHILFEEREGEDRTALDQRIAAARAKLEGGADFGAVAAEFSDDVGSASNGGDLGYSSGDAFPPEMEAAIAQLEVNEVSEPVKTDAGVHIIRLTDRREGHAPGLADVRLELEDQIQLARARTELLRTVEELRDMVFNAEDLSGPARELNLVVARSEPIGRDQGEGLLANPAVLAAAFSEEVLEAGNNSEVLELGGDSFVVVRVHKHNPPQLRELAEVREAISARIIDQAARAKVAAEADRIVTELAAGANMEQLASAAGYAWQNELGADRRNTALPPEVLGRAFDMPAPPSGKAMVDFVMTPTGDAQVISLTRVSPGQLSNLEPSEQLLLQRQASSEYANLLNNEFLRGLRERADISVI